MKDESDPLGFIRPSLPTDAQVLSPLELVHPRLAHRIGICRSGLASCRERHCCPRCADNRSRALTTDYSLRLERMRAPGLLTLTVPGRRHLSRAWLQGIIESFNKLRRRTRFSRAVAGGVAVVHVEHGDSGWTPHLHILFESRASLASAWVKDQWATLTGGWDVDLRPVDLGTQHSVLEYGVRPLVVPEDPKLLSEFLEARRRLQFIRPFGNMHPAHRRRPSWVTTLRSDDPC